MIFPVTVTNLQTFFLVFNAAVSFTIMKGALENLKGGSSYILMSTKGKLSSLYCHLANTVNVPHET